MRLYGPRTNLKKRPKRQMIKTWLISPGHGKNTAGKRDPEGKLLEWAFNRRLLDRIVYYAEKMNIPVVVLDYEENDTPLSQRTARANKYGRNTCYISIHGNAAGDGKHFNNARGWAIYTSKGYTKADPIANVFIEEADKLLPEIGCKVRKYSQKIYEQDWEENFYVLRNTIMPAVLTENLFFTNRKERDIMLSDEGIDCLARIHANAMKRIMEEGL